MKLLTAAILKNLPKLYATESVPTEDKIARFKLFFPSGRFTFYCVEGEKEGSDYRLFGYTKSALGPDSDEWGYASLNELQDICVRGLRIERDRWFTPTRMQKILSGEVS